MLTDSRKKVICIMGPTASGKSRLSLALADQIPCEIVSVDSALVYRGMDIGTAKPTSDELAQVPHHLIDICDPAEPYSAGQFCQDATRKMTEILARGKTPILVGGTMLYFRALTTGLAKMPTSCPKIRAKIDQDAQEKGWSYLHAELAKLDPIAAARIHPHDAQRIQRALEVYELTGQPLSEYHKDEDISKDYQYCFIGLLPSDRSRLHERIAQRFDLMLKQGFIAEVERLRQREDLHPDLPALRAVGYRQVWDYLAGAMNYEELRERGIAATRQLAKRQLTWLRSWKGLIAFDCFDSSLLDKVCGFLAKAAK